MLSITHLQTELTQLVDTYCAPLPVRSRQRLTFFVAGILLAGTIVLRRIATTHEHVSCGAPCAASHERRLRRVLNDGHLDWAQTYAPMVQRVLRWQSARRLYLLIDESGHSDVVRVLTAAVWYRGRAIPLAWLLWPAQQPATTPYWQQCATLLARCAALIPKRVEVVVLADRAFGCPAFTDLVAAHGWHWLVRVQGQTRYRDAQGQVLAVRSVLTRRGQRWKGRGHLFKDAGWRCASVVAYWSLRHKEPLLLASSVPPTWELIALYRRRSAIEALFRDWKAAGWDWEASQVRALAHQERLVLGLAWATLVVLCLGETAAAAELGRAGRGVRSRPWAAKHSLFRLGRDELQRRLWQGDTTPIHWELAHFEAPNWSAECRQHHAPPGTVVRARAQAA